MFLAVRSDRSFRVRTFSASACSILAVERCGGRSVATVAEICFAVQWAMTLHQLAR